jgi:TorA maturation chaperone TorD
VWSSADCPQGAGNVFYRVPSRGETKQLLEWDRKSSAADQCQNPPQQAAAPDTYVVEVKAPGMPVARTSFVLKQD